MNRTGSPTPKRKPQRPSLDAPACWTPRLATPAEPSPPDGASSGATRSVSRSTVFSSTPDATASESRRNRFSASPRPPSGASESYAPPPRSESGGNCPSMACQRAVTVCVTVPSPPAIAITRGFSEASCCAARVRSSGVRVSSSGAPGAALRSCCAQSGHSRLRRALGLAMIAIPAMSDAHIGPAPAAQGLFLAAAPAPLNVVLVQPRIPPNTGNVARLCAVTGSRLHLVAPLGFSIDDARLKRAGLDYWDKVHAATWGSFDELVESQSLDPERVHLFTGRGQ